MQCARWTNITHLHTNTHTVPCFILNWTFQSDCISPRGVWNMCLHATSDKYTIIHLILFSFAFIYVFSFFLSMQNSKRKSKYWYKWDEIDQPKKYRGGWAVYIGWRDAKWNGNNVKNIVITVLDSNTSLAYSRAGAESGKKVFTSQFGATFSNIFMPAAIAFRCQCKFCYTHWISRSLSPSCSRLATILLSPCLFAFALFCLSRYFVVLILFCYICSCALFRLSAFVKSRNVKVMRIALGKKQNDTENCIEKVK